ncbi:MAG: DUF5615 family PIN-like protein [Candidatus Baldrarchaeia archaeon]
MDDVHDVDATENLNDHIRRLKSAIKSRNWRIIVDKNVGGEVFREIRRFLAGSEFLHVGEDDRLRDAKDREIIDFATKNGYSMVVTMDYGFARMALDAGLEVILILEYERHRRFKVVYLAELGEMRFRLESTL